MLPALDEWAISGASVFFFLSPSPRLSRCFIAGMAKRSCGVLGARVKPTEHRVISNRPHFLGVREFSASVNPVPVPAVGHLKSDSDESRSGLGSGTLWAEPRPRRWCYCVIARHGPPALREQSGEGGSHRVSLGFSHALFRAAIPGEGS